MRTFMRQYACIGLPNMFGAGIGGACEIKIKRIYTWFYSYCLLYSLLHFRIQTLAGKREKMQGFACWRFLGFDKCQLPAGGRWLLPRLFPVNYFLILFVHNLLFYPSSTGHGNVTNSLTNLFSPCLPFHKLFHIETKHCMDMFTAV